MSDMNGELKVRFTYHEVKPHQIPIYQEIRAEALAFALLLAERVPESRELALALTKLEECVMHANSGVARRT